LVYADKRWIYEESFRTPMVMRYPGTIKPGTVSDHFVLNLDIASTVLDAAKLPIPAQMQGQSMLPALSGKTDQKREVIYYPY